MPVKLGQPGSRKARSCEPRCFATHDDAPEFPQQRTAEAETPEKGKSADAFCEAVESSVRIPFFWRLTSGMDPTPRE